MEEELEEITQKEFELTLRDVKRYYLQEINEFTKLFYGCEDIEKHLNHLKNRNYSIKYFKREDGSITYEFKEKQQVGFRGST